MMKHLLFPCKATICALLLGLVALFVGSCRDERYEPIPNHLPQDPTAVLKENLRLALGVEIPVDAGGLNGDAFEARSITLFGEPPHTEAYTPYMDWSTCEWDIPEKKPVVLLSISNGYAYVQEEQIVGGRYDQFVVLDSKDYVVTMNPDRSKAPTLRIYTNITLKEGTRLEDYYLSAMILDHSYRSNVAGYEETGRFDLKQPVEYLSRGYDLRRELHSGIFKNLIFGLSPTHLKKFLSEETPLEDKMGVRFKPLNTALVVELADPDKNSRINKAVIRTNYFATDATLSLAMSDFHKRGFLATVGASPYSMPRSKDLTLTVENLFEDATDAADRYHRVLILALPWIPHSSPYLKDYKFKVDYYDTAGVRIEDKAWEGEYLISPWRYRGKAAFVNAGLFAAGGRKFWEASFETKWRSGADGVISFYVHPKYNYLGNKTPISYLPLIIFQEPGIADTDAKKFVLDDASQWKHIRFEGRPNATYYIKMRNLAGFSTVAPTSSYREPTTPEKLVEVSQWGGTNEWGRGTGNRAWITGQGLSFEGTTQLEKITARDVPNLSYMRDFVKLFKNSGVRSINRIEDWDTGRITSLYETFSGARNFNGDLSKWDVSNVTDMTAMFDGAISFNQSLGNWDVRQVKYADYMFHNAQSFNKPLGSWTFEKLSGFQNFFFKSGVTRAVAVMTFDGWIRQSELNPSLYNGIEWETIALDGDFSKELDYEGMPSFRWLVDNRGWRYAQKI